MTTKLVVLPLETYNKAVLDLAEEIAQTHERICYVTMNKTERAMIEIFNKKGVDQSRFHFIDFISPQAILEASSHWHIYKKCLLDSRLFADEIISMVEKKKITAVIIDSLSSCLVYEPERDFRDFVGYLLRALKDHDVCLFMTILKEDENRRPIRDLKKFIEGNGRVKTRKRTW